MTSVKDVKAALAGVVDQSDSQLQQIRQLIQNAERQIALLRVLTRGADPGRIGDAIGRIERSRQHLTDASELVTSHNAAVREYIQILG